MPTTAIPTTVVVPTASIALLKARFPVSIEQDLAYWDRKGGSGEGRVVLSHSPETTGSEPLLRDYFLNACVPSWRKPSLTMIVRPLAIDRPAF